MTRVRIEWDPAKDEQNVAKHGISFAEASELFTSNVDYLEFFDEAHSDDEERFIAIGPVKRGLVLVVWTERGEDSLRIISARWATRVEQMLFRKHMEAGS